MRGGSYMVTRRIRMLIETWDRASLDDQEQTIGRDEGGRRAARASRARRSTWRSRPTTASRDPGRRARPRSPHPTTNGGVRILRRGYSFTDGVDPRLGELDAGLFFIAYSATRDAVRALQRRLGASDALNEYIKHARLRRLRRPAGHRPGELVGAGLFA